MSTQIQAGDEVTFTARGRSHSGTVNRVRMKQRKGRTRRLAESVTGDASSLDRLVAEVATTDGVWTVAVTMLTKTGKGDRLAAAEQVAAVRGRIATARHKRSSANYDAASAADLTSLKLGDAIEVEFRGGRLELCKFHGFVPSSGNVRFQQSGSISVRTTPAKFVRRTERTLDEGRFPTTGKRGPKSISDLFSF